jgi:hypothetical protein
MGFRTNILPCIEVLRADGRVCQGFRPKPAAEPSVFKAPSKVKQKEKTRKPSLSRRGRPKGSLDILVE